jgi:hypothetical protein
MMKVFNILYHNHACDDRWKSTKGFVLCGFSARLAHDLKLPAKRHPRDGNADQQRYKHDVKGRP